jgi:hypothetical protein
VIGTIVVVQVTVIVVVLAVAWAGSWYFTRQPPQRTEPTEWCEVCGGDITEGWALYEVMASTGDPQEHGGGSGMSAYWCDKHRPDGDRAVPWRS